MPAANFPRNQSTFIEVCFGVLINWTSWDYWYFFQALNFFYVFVFVDDLCERRVYRKVSNVRIQWTLTKLSCLSSFPNIEINLYLEMCTYKEHLNEWISAHISILRSRLLSSENLCLVILWLRLTAVQLLSDHRDNAVCDKIIRPYICSFKS